MKGSPPRGRGKGTAGLSHRQGVGITPAWAGKSRLRKMYRPAFTGSPPCGRGKGSFTMTSFQCFGITPAWAGKSRHSGKRWPRPWDHPRVGGEKSSLSSASLHGPGSPPRGRGKVLVDSEIRPLHRITPAQTGKGRCSSAKGKAVQDHPRMGGEKPELRGYDGKVVGSPPRGRGKARHLSHGLLPCG